MKSKKLKLSQNGRCEPYSKLKESFVLFLSLKNPFGKNLPVYTFNRTCEEDDSVELGDVSHSVIFNCAAWNKEKNSALREFLSFVKGTGKADSNLTKEIHNMVEQKKFEQTFINEYMAWNLHDTDVEQRGMAKQKAEDEKLLSRQAAEIQRLQAELAKLKASQAR